LRRFLDPNFLRDRAESFSEGINRFVGFEDVEDTEPVRPFSAAWTSRPSNGRSSGASIRVLPVRAPDDFFVVLLRQPWRLMDREDQRLRRPQRARIVLCGDWIAMPMNDLPLAALVTERRRHAKVERLDRVAVADMGAPVFDLENGCEFVARVARDFIEARPPGRRSSGSMRSRVRQNCLAAAACRSEWVRERHIVRLRTELLYRAGIAARKRISSTVVAIEELVNTHQRESDTLNPVIGDGIPRAADRRPRMPSSR
jgi:hypothetical protein